MLIGNPQNMLIGETLRLSFARYLAQAALPVVLGLLVTWGIVIWRTRRGWHRGAVGEPSHDRRGEGVAFDGWQTTKGLGVAAAIFGAFLFAPWPRETVALTGAGLLLLSRRLHSYHMLGLVDWQLLVPFVGLFVVNHAMQATGLPDAFVADLAGVVAPAPTLSAPSEAAQLTGSGPGGGQRTRLRIEGIGAGDHEPTGAAVVERWNWTSPT